MKMQKIFWKLFLSYVTVLALITLFVGVYFFNYAHDSIIKNAFSHLDELANKTTVSIDNEIKGIDQITIDFLANKIFIERLAKSLGELGETGVEEAKSDVLEFINSVYVNNNSIYRITVFRNKNEILSTKKVDKSALLDHPFFDKNWYTEKKLPQNGKLILPEHPDNWVSDKRIAVISILRPIYLNEIELGYIEVQKAMNVFLSGTETKWSGKPVSLLIVDSSNKIMHATDYINKKEYYQQIVNDEIENFSSNSVENSNELIVIRNSNYTDFKFALILDKSLLFDSDVYFVYATIGYLSLAFLLMCVYIFFMTKRIINPINSLVSKMAKIDFDNIGEKIEISGRNYENIILTAAFNKMSKRISDGLQKEKMMKDANTKTMFAMLQSKIGPHFLYNTLGSIANMCESGEIEEATKACYDLSDILRYSANYTETIVDFSEEIENAEQFMSLMKGRYRYRMNYKIDVPKKYTDFRIPKLTLQPLIENGIKYSLTEIEIVDITLSLVENEDYFLIKVTDNGAGFSEEKINELDKEIKHYLSDEGQYKLEDVKFGGMGLVGTIIRLHLLYGEKFKYSFGNEEGGGATIILKIPKKEELQ